MQLQEALSQISEIQTRFARADVFRGYRSATVGFTGFVGIACGYLQWLYIPEPLQNLSSYLTLWLSAAVISLVVVGAELSARCYFAASPRTSRHTLQAVEQFLPCVIAGALTTAALGLGAPECAWMLPGLWAILFSLGVFASWRLLPGSIFWAGGFYLIAGIVCVAIGSGEQALAPWMMAGTFGGGQLLTACLLYWNLERAS